MTADVGLYYVYKVEPTGKNNIPDVMRLAETLYGLYVAERKRFLANWYARPVRAPMVAAAAEAAFDTEAAEAGLRCNDGIEPTDLNTPVTPVTSTSTPEASLASAKGKGKSTSARMSSKPM